MAKPVIFRVTNNLKIGGIQRRLRSLLPRLAEDFEVHLVTYHDKGIFWDELANLGVKTHFVPVKGKWSPVGIFKLSRLFKKYRADIVHTHSLGGNISGILAAAWAGVPVRIGNVHHRGEHWYASGPLHRNKQILQEHIIHRLFSDRILFVSRESLDYFREKTRLPVEMLMTLHNGLDFDEMQPKQDPAVIRRKLGIAPSKKIVGFVGRLTKGKGISHFLEFAKKVARQTDEYVFIVVGGRNEMELNRLKETAAPWISHSVLIFTGEQKNVYDYYNLFDCFLFPSDAKWEGMPGVVLEACAFALPVISRRNRPVEEIAMYYPNILFDEGDTTPVQLLERALSLPPPNLAAFWDEFSIHTMALRTKTLYFDLLRHKRAHSLTLPTSG